MISLLIINVSAEVMNEWLNALRDSGMAVHANSMSPEKACRHLSDETSYDLVIYHSHDNQPDEEFFECLSNSINKAPVIISCESPSTAFFEKFAANGVKDIFQSQDINRLALIAKREIDAHRVSKELAELKNRFTESENRYHNLLDTSEEAIAYIQDGMHMHINPAYRSVFGYIDEDELFSKPVMDLISTNYQNYFKQFLKTASQLTDEQVIELECIRSDEQPFKALLTFSPAVFEGENCIQMQVENIDLQQKVRQVSGQDPQTGLYSRHHFMQDLENLFIRKDTQANQTSLLYIMVDNFEELKSQHGLMATDLILQEMSGLLQSQLTPGMTLYRFGDHSFTVLIENDDNQQARMLADSLIRLTVNHIYTLVGGVIAPTLSIGLTCTDLGNTDNSEQAANSFLNHAYQACREIYTNAGDGFLAYENLARQLPAEDEIDAIDDTIHLKELLAYALEHDRYRLVFQPIVSIQGDTSENYAVLLRLLNNDNEEIRPRHFLKQAVQYGYMADIDRWVIKHAINEIARQRNKNNRLNFFIQLSENAIQDDTLLLWIVDCLREANAKGVWLTFQFNFPDVCDHILAAEKLILGLKKINCNIAINQFENSKHARQMLERIPVDVIKLHHSMLNDIETDGESRQQLVELNNVTRAQQIKTVASKIEKPDVLSVLWHIGINYIQGFSLQEPAPVISYEQQ